LFGRLFTWSRRRTYGAVFVVLGLAVGVYFATRAPDLDRTMDRAKAFQARGENSAAMIELNNVLAARSNDHNAFFLAGQSLEKLGDLVGAENALRRALEHGHSSDEVLPILGRVLLDLEKYAEVVKVIGDEVQSGKATAPALAVLRGRAHLGLDEFEQAETQFRVSQSIKPSAGAKLGLAQVALADRDRATTERLLNEVLQEEPTNLQALLYRAELMRLAGRMDEAAAALQKAYEAHPQNVEAVSALAVFELGRDRLDLAKPLVLKLQGLSPRGPRPRYARALLAYKENRLNDARIEIKRLSETLPNHPPALLLTGMVQFADGRYDQAQSAFGAYLKRYPGEPAALRMLGATLLAKGQPHLAANIFTPYVGSTQDVGVMAIAAESFRQLGRTAQSRAILQRAITAEPKNPDLRRILALVDLGEGARERAIAGLRAAIALGPADARADEALVMTLLGARQFGDAQAAAAAVTERLPRSSHAFTLKAAVEIVQQQYDQARATLEHALKLDPANLDAVEALAQVDAAQQKPDSRRERLEAIVKHDVNHASAWIALAKLDLALGRHAHSAASIRQALAAAPQSINALLLLADTQFRQGHYEDAVISARQAHNLHPDDTRAIAVLGEALLAKGDKEPALEMLAKLIKKQPDATSGYLRLAAAYLAVGDPVNARATALSALNRDPNDRGVRAMLADIYLQTGALRDAAALAAKTQKDDPSSALGFRMEGDMHLANKDYAKATEAYRKAAAMQLTGAQLVKIHQAQSAASSSPVNDNALRTWVQTHPDDIDTRFYLADSLSDAGRNAEAAEHYREILRRIPSSARAMNNLAWVLHSAGDKTAVEHARKAVQLAPTNALTLDTLGWILVQQGNAGEGIPALLKAVALDAANLEIRYHLAQAMLKIGDARRAKAELQTVLASNRPFRYAAEARALAAKLGPAEPVSKSFTSDRPESAGAATTAKQGK
jgi:putative PEP-CTERM system TPR-repeat lipoprotein